MWVLRQNGDHRPQFVLSDSVYIFVRGVDGLLEYFAHLDGLLERVFVVVLVFLDRSL